MNTEILKDISYSELKGIKITFINMPLREAAQPNTPPEGPGILAAIVRRYGGEPYGHDDIAGNHLKGGLGRPSPPSGCSPDHEARALRSSGSSFAFRELALCSGLFTVIHCIEITVLDAGILVAYLPASAGIPWLSGWLEGANIKSLHPEYLSG